MNKLSALRRRVEPLLPIRAAEATMRWAMLSPPIRAAVNRFYNALDWRQKHYFWRLFAGAFVDRDAGAQHQDCRKC